MIVIVAADPVIEEPEVEPPPVRNKYGFGISLTGVDGSTWDLNSDQVGALGGIIGLGDSAPVHRWVGTSWRGLEHDVPRKWTSTTPRPNRGGACPVEMTGPEQDRHRRAGAGGWSCPRRS